MMKKSIIIPTLVYLSLSLSGCDNYSAKSINQSRENSIVQNTSPVFYFTKNYSKNCEKRPKNESIKAIILHYTDAMNYVKDPEKNPEKNLEECLKRTEECGVSYHVIIGRDGSYKWMVSPDYIAYHSGPSMTPDRTAGVNRFSISIALIGKSNSRFTENQYQTLAEICKEIYLNNGSIPIYGHEEITKDFCRWGIRDDIKTDPGIKTGNFKMGKFMKYFNARLNHRKGD